MDRHGWDERYSARERTFPSEPNRLVAEEVDGLAPGWALDLGSGEGRHAVWLASLGWQVVAVDFSAVGLARAQARARAEVGDGDGTGAVAFVVADVDTIRLPPGRFDLVLAAFFHPQGSYRRLTDALAPGGSFVEVGYDLANLTEGTGGPKNPAFLLRPAEIAAGLGALGLRVARAETVRLPDLGVVDAVVRATKPMPGELAQADPAR